MLKSNYLKFLAISFIILLTACGGFASPAGVDEAPAVDVEPQAAPVEATEMEPAEPAAEAAPPGAENTETERPEAGVISSETEAVEEEAAMIVADEQPENDIEEAKIEAVENQAEAAAETAAVDAVDNKTAAEEVAPVETAPEEAVEAKEASPAEEESLPEDQAVKKTGPSLKQQALLATLNVLGQPPELFNEVWLNSEPLKLADLRGQVVIVEFWTFG